MYRLGHEKRLAAMRSVHRVAIFATVLCVNAVVVGLFIFAVVMSDNGIAATRMRLGATQQALAKVVDEQGGKTTDDELGLVRIRAERVLWSRVMRAVARLTPKQMWLPRMSLSESDLGGGMRVPGLRLSGRMTAASEEEGMRVLMELVNGLRGDPYFRRHFLEPRLVRSTWLTEDGSKFLEFDVFSPLNTPEALQSGAAAIPEAGWKTTIDEEDVEFEDTMDTEDMGAGGERKS